MKKEPANYFVDIDNTPIKPTDFISYDDSNFRSRGKKNVDKIADKIMKFKKPFWRLYTRERVLWEEYEDGAISTSYIPDACGCPWEAVRGSDMDFYKKEGEDENDVRLRLIEHIKNELNHDEWRWALVYYFPNGEDPNVEKNGGVLVCKFKIDYDE